MKYKLAIGFLVSLSSISDLGSPLQSERGKSLTEVGAAAVESRHGPTRPRSIDGSQSLIVLSGTYGICVGGRFVSERWRTYTYNDHSYAETVFHDAKGRHEIFINMGSLETSHLELHKSRQRFLGADVFYGVEDGRRFLLTRTSLPAKPSEIMIEFDEDGDEVSRQARDLIAEIRLCEIRVVAIDSPGG
ncbi:hypothetical protein [Arenimonas sp.]|uniref:hypothetical protein n=1 Tax=Arenimonas sp. TaxID=1872635 RepID=UPI002E31BB80|nr:hypothetical protein [Arenimonas sp.]HEX4852991.1 hypothetical protein [Arenimonas sp.]